MNNFTIGKWLMYMGILLFSVGLSFIIVKEFAPYIIIGIILMIVGVGFNLISVAYKKRRRD